MPNIHRPRGLAPAVTDLVQHNGKVPLIRKGGSAMFANYRTDDDFHRPTAEIKQILRAAGCDTTHEPSLQMGMVACAAALLVSTHTPRNSSLGSAQKSRSGRNEPCPCGSGR